MCLKNVAYLRLSSLLQLKIRNECDPWLYFIYKIIENVVSADLKFVYVFVWLFFLSHLLYDASAAKETETDERRQTKMILFNHSAYGEITHLSSGFFFVIFPVYLSLNSIFNLSFFESRVWHGSQLNAVVSVIVLNHFFLWAGYADGGKKRN